MNLSRERVQVALFRDVQEPRELNIARARSDCVLHQLDLFVSVLLAKCECCCSGRFAELNCCRRWGYWLFRGFEFLRDDLRWLLENTLTRSLLCCLFHVAS